MSSSSDSPTDNTKVTDKLSSSKSKMISAVVISIIFLVIGLIIYGLHKSANSHKDSENIIQGQMDMQSTSIASKVPGRIAAILVTEGDEVSTGQQLIEMDSPEINAKIKQAEAGREMAQSQLDKANNGARPQEVGRARAAWEGSQAAAELARSTYERINRLYQEGLMAQQKRDEAYTQYVARREQADAARLQYDMALEGARGEDIAAAKAQVAQVDAKVEEAYVAQDEANLKSPIAGIVDDVIVNTGEVIGQGVPIMTLVDPDDQWVVLNVTENNLNQLGIGQIFQGTIPALSTPDTPFTMKFKVYASSAMPDFATWRATNNEDKLDVRTFEVKARPIEPSSEVRAGMSVLVTLDPKLSVSNPNKMQ